MTKVTSETRGNPMRSKGLQNLIDFMIEDIMALTDEEILAEATPQEIEDAEQMRERALALLPRQPTPDPTTTHLRQK